MEQRQHFLEYIIILYLILTKTNKQINKKQNKTEETKQNKKQKQNKTNKTKSGVFLVLFDLSAAFDTIDHDILFTRLESIGVRGLK